MAAMRNHGAIEQGVDAKVALHATRLRNARDKLNLLLSEDDSGTEYELEEIVAMLIYIEKAAREAREVFHWPDGRAL